MGRATTRIGSAIVGALLASMAFSAPAHAEPAALSGTITASDTGLPVTACVDAYTLAYDWAGSACGDDTGAWQIDGLDSGTEYKVHVYPQDGAHIEQWVHDATSFETATTLVAPATVDVKVAPGAILAGSLTMADGDPLPSDASVTIWSATSDFSTMAWPYAGEWQVLVPAGTYQVEFAAAGMTRQWAVGKATRADADAVTAAAGQTTRVDDVLQAIDEATFSGTVTAAGTGDPLDACVTAYVADDYRWAGGTCTDTSGANPGQWSMDQLEAGRAYKFQFESFDGVHLGEWATDARDFDAATPFIGPATVDVALDPGAMISGTLRRADGQPATDTWVSVEPVRGLGDYASTMTSESGEWSLLVREGDYKVGFFAWPLEQWAFGATDRRAAQVFHATTATPVVVDDSLLAVSRITGTIRDEVTGDAVPGACVEVLRRSDTMGEYPSVGQTCSDETGDYSVDVLGGDYVLRFYDPEYRYAPEHHADVAREQDATPVPVSPGATVNVDAALGAAATLSGIAVDARTDAPVAGVCPLAYWGASGGIVRGSGGDCSDEKGRWTIKGLPAGDFALGFDPGQEDDTHARTWAHKAETQADATLVTVKPGSAHTIRKVQMPLGGSISGLVTDVFGNPVAGAYVDAEGWVPLRAGAGEGRYDAVTDDQGRYTINGLPEGDYRPSVYSRYFDAFAPEWSGDADSRATATPIKVKAAKTTALDVEVAPGATFRGSVVGADGQPYARSLEGDVYDSEGHEVGTFFWDGARFHTSALPGGDLTLSLFDWETDQRWWYDGAGTAADATPLHFVRGETKEITFHLR